MLKPPLAAINNRAAVDSYGWVLYIKYLIVSDTIFFPAGIITVLNHGAKTVDATFNNHGAKAKLPESSSEGFINAPYTIPPVVVGALGMRVALQLIT